MPAHSYRANLTHNLPAADQYSLEELQVCHVIGHHMAYSENYRLHEETKARSQASFRSSIGTSPRRSLSASRENLLMASFFALSVHLCIGLLTGLLIWMPSCLNVPGIYTIHSENMWRIFRKTPKTEQFLRDRCAWISICGMYGGDV